MTFIKKLTASDLGSTLSFVNGSSEFVLDFVTYKEYIFIFNNIHPPTDSVYFTFQARYSTNYNVTNANYTSTLFSAIKLKVVSATALVIDQE